MRRRARPARAASSRRRRPQGDRGTATPAPGASRAWGHPLRRGQGDRRPAARRPRISCVTSRAALPAALAKDSTAPVSSPARYTRPYPTGSASAKDRYATPGRRVVRRRVRGCEQCAPATRDHGSLADLVLALVARFGNARLILGGLILGGLLLASLSYALFLPVGADWTYLAMLPGLLLAARHRLRAGLRSAHHRRDRRRQGGGGAGLADGLLYTSFQFGAALGLSAAATVNVAAAASEAPAALLDGYRAALWVLLAVALLATLVSVFGVRSRRSVGSQVIGRGGRPAEDRTTELPAVR